MEMKKLQRKFAVISNPNTVAKMFSKIKRKDELEVRLIDIELRLDAHERKINDLKELIHTLGIMIEQLKMEVKELGKSKYGPGL